MLIDCENLITTNKSKLIGILLLFIWCRYTIFTYIIQIIYKVTGINGLGEWIFIISIISIILFSIKEFIKNIIVSDIVFIIIVILLYLLSYLNSNNIYWLNILVSNFFFGVLPMYFLGLAVDLKCDIKIFKTKQLIDWLYIASVINVFIAIVYRIYSIIVDKRLLYDDGYAATMITPSILFCIYYAFVHKKIYQFVIIVIGILVILQFGTRTALLCIAIMIFFYLLQISNKKVRFIIFSILACVFIWGMNIINILMNHIEIMLSDLGMSTRIFYFINNNDIFSLTNRNILYDKIMKAIITNPLIGYGIRGDWPLINTYSHNLFLEIWLQFGIVIGTFILLALTSVLLNGYIKARNNESTRGFILVLFCYVIVRLMFSGSYLEEGMFFMLIGICIKTIRINESKFLLVKRNK